MAYRIFISSVQREFAKERKVLAEMIRKDMLLGTFFEVYLFEETTAQNRSAQSVYLDEVRNSDIYLGLFGTEYGFEDVEGVSPTEREYDLATECGKCRLAFVKRASLPRGWTAANLLKTHDSKPHNGILATAMQWAGYVEKSGYGTEDIVRKCKAWGLRDPEYHPSSVDFRLVLWRQEIKEPRDFTQVGEVGSKKGVESSVPRGVESNAEKPIKSRVCGGSSRLHSTPQKGVESRGGVALSLREQILLLIAEKPQGSTEVARSFGFRRVYGNLARRIATLLDDQLIEQTMPDKPNSRLQKYRITRRGRQVVKLLVENQSLIMPAKDEESSAASAPTKAGIGR